MKKKIPAARKFPSPPHNFSNGPSLIISAILSIATWHIFCFIKSIILIVFSSLKSQSVHQRENKEHDIIPEITKKKI